MPAKEIEENKERFIENTATTGEVYNGNTKSIKELDREITEYWDSLDNYEEEGPAPLLSKIKGDPTRNPTLNQTQPNMVTEADFAQVDLTWCKKLERKNG